MVRQKNRRRGRDAFGSHVRGRKRDCRLRSSFRGGSLMKRKMVRGLTLSCCIVPCTTSGAFGQFAYVSSFNGPARAIVDLDPTEKLDFVSRKDPRSPLLVNRKSTRLNSSH